MMKTETLVYLVDDEETIRRSTSFMLKSSGLSVTSFETGIAFLKVAKSLEPGCILLDIRMPGMDGLEVQAELAAQGVTMPIIFMTGHGDITTAVRAMKAGAVDFLEKPFEKSVLLAALERAAARIEQSDLRAIRAAEAVARLNVLTPREREVLDGLIDGLPNKTIAYDLGISPRTVEIHRANLMTKLGVKSLSEALRIAFAAADAA